MQSSVVIASLFFQQKLGDGLLSGRNKFHSLQGAGCLRLTCSVFPELCVNLVVGVSMNRCAVRCFHWWIIRGKKYLLELLESAGIIHLVSLEVAHWAKLILDYVQKYFGSTLHGIQIYGEIDCLKEGIVSQAFYCCSYI